MGPLNGKPAQVEASAEHPDGYELTAIPVVALHMMGHLPESRQHFHDMEQMGVRVQTTVR